MKSDLQKFYDLLTHYPKFQPYWDQEQNTCDTATLTTMCGLSSGEGVIRDALLSIWNGNAGAENKIDITDLAALSIDARKPLIQWLIAPFWP